MEPKPDDSAAVTQTHKDAMPASISSGEGAASALSRLRTMEKAEADTGLSSLGEPLEGPDRS